MSDQLTKLIPVKEQVADPKKEGFKPWDFTTMILKDKPNINFADDRYKTYDCFMVNRLLSSNLNYVLLINEVNKNAVSKPIHYEFFKTAIPKTSDTFLKLISVKKEKSIEELEYIAKYYEVSYREAKEYATILNDEEIESISDKYKYGKNGKNKV